MGRTCARSSADLETCGGEIGVRRHREVLRRGTPAHAARDVVLRAVAMAEPAAIITLGEGWGAAQMGAHADNYDPFRLDLAVLIGRRRVIGEIGVACDGIDQRREGYGARRGD